MLDVDDDQKTIRLYRGDAHHRVHEGMFLSSDPDFCESYGEVRAYDLTLESVFDTRDLDRIRSLLPLHDPYDDTEIETVEDYEARLSDTWEMIESTVGVESLGSVVIVTEGGVVNYIVNDVSLVRPVLAPTPAP